MSFPAMTVESLIASVASWAGTQPSIRALALVGSHARGSARSDSDVDLVLLATDPRRYLSDTTWLAEFGEVSGAALEQYGPATSVRAFFPNGLEVEFTFVALSWAAIPLDAGTRSVVENGFRALHDPDGLLARLLAAI